MAHEYEVGFVAENARENLAQIKDFAKTIDAYFPPNVLTGFNINLWSGSNVIGFWLFFEKFESEYMEKLQAWMHQYNIKVLEVMHLPEAEREKMRNEFLFTGDFRFAGDFEIEVAFKLLDQKLQSID
ncbi:MAG: hypothetical protein GWO41_02505 [candidate division Zixibacteria bacterium]|nr:hypothetical protein [candidate division Zixibacteria bacterium]NIW39512.1 hypothetical protein [candidate division Zixibacteria bacterium]NIX58779.1 hypothetical protein [candidate division Zixibacteria bacterium]